MSGKLARIDCEMAGSDLKCDVLIRVAMLVTDKDLNVLGEGVDVLTKPTDEQLAGMSDLVREMHTKLGLLDALAGGIMMEKATRTVLNHVRKFVPTAHRAPLTGNTIGTDYAFLARDMPELGAHVYYRNMDVSSLKELARRWFPQVLHQAPAKQGNHRAPADIQKSIEELRYYREATFVAPPGLTTNQVKQIAARHRGSLTGLAAPEVESVQ